MDIEHFIRLSYTYAIEAKQLGDGPYGALILDEQHEIIARAGNTTSSDHSVTYHAEINAIQQAEYKRGVGRLGGCTLVSSAEPCPMCASAIVWSGLDTVIYGVSIDTLIEKGHDQIQIPSRAIFEKAERQIKVVGPNLEDEGQEVFSQTF